MFAQPTEKIHFPALNGLRFWAAFFVVIHHIEQTKSFFNLPNSFTVTAVDHIGGHGVSLFFVLSGFLITYLLLAESSQTQTIQLKNFYMRRIFRIWPLYYLVVALAFFILPLFYGTLGWNQNFHTGLAVKLMLYAAILPNACLAFFPEVLGANQLWSIGVEEQFYLLWPILVKYFRLNIVWVFLLILGGKSCANILYDYLSAHPSFLSHIPLLNGSIEKFHLLLQDFEIEKLAIGSIGAYLLFENKKNFLDIIYHPVMLVLACAGLVLYTFFNLHIHFYGVWLGFIFLIILMNICRKPHWLTDHPAIDYMGKISYSVYMLHQLVILAVMGFGKKLFSGASFQLFLYGLSLPLTFAVSMVSYEFFEKPFLKFKNRFTVVPSGS